MASNWPLLAGSGGAYEGLYDSTVILEQGVAAYSPLLAHGVASSISEGGIVLPRATKSKATVVGFDTGKEITAPSVTSAVVKIGSYDAVADDIFGIRFDISNPYGVFDAILESVPAQIYAAIDDFLLTDSSTGLAQSSIATVSLASDAAGSTYDAISAAMKKVEDNNLDVTGMAFSLKMKAFFRDEKTSTNFPVFVNPLEPDTPVAAGPAETKRVFEAPITFGATVSGTFNSKNILGVVGDFSHLVYGFVSSEYMERSTSGNVKLDDGSDYYLRPNFACAYRTAVAFAAGIRRTDAFCIITE